jgi:hypothetical protein
MFQISLLVTRTQFAGAGVRIIVIEPLRQRRTCRVKNSVCDIGASDNVIRGGLKTNSSVDGETEVCKRPRNKSEARRIENRIGLAWRDLVGRKVT